MSLQARDVKGDDEVEEVKGMKDGEAVHRAAVVICLTLIASPRVHDVETLSSSQICHISLTPFPLCHTYSTCSFLCVYCFFGII